MYSRNYGRGDIPTKINLPPSYSGSAIQEPVYKYNEEKEEEKTAPVCQANIGAPACEEHKEVPVCKAPEHSACESPKKEKNSFLSGLLSDIDTEDLILIGIIAALVFDLADKDILLVALVIAAVLM